LHCTSWIALTARVYKDPALSNNISNSGGNVAIVDKDAGWGRPINVDNEDDVKEAVVASGRSFKKRRRVSEEGRLNITTTWRSRTSTRGRSGNWEACHDQSAADDWRFDVRFAATQLVNKEEGPTEEQMETVYRDTTGQKIDTKAARAEAARVKREREARRMEWGKGIVQRGEKEKAKRRDGGTRERLRAVRCCLVLSLSWTEFYI
jgi:pre-mRNA-splicing factor CWC26